MKKRDHKNRATLFSAFVLWLAASHAEAVNIEFVSDYLRFDENNQTVSLSGAVEIKSALGYFYPEFVDYNIDTEELFMGGQLNGVLATGERFIADFAELDFKSQQTLLMDVKVFLLTEMQVAAQKFHDDDFITYAENVVASSCVVCAVNPTPIWQIRASQLLNNKSVKKIYLKNAFFDVRGIPVFYLPYLRVPSYDAVRMSGFLAPTFKTTELGDIGVSMPYYFALSPFSDARVTPFFNSGETQILEYGFRQNGPFYKLRAKGASSLYTGPGDTEYRYYLEGDISAKLPYDFTATANYTLQSDYDFHSDFGYSNSASNNFILSRTQNTNLFDFETRKYRPTSEANIAADQPFVFPKIQFSHQKVFDNGFSLNSDFEYLRLYPELSDDITRFSAHSDLQYYSVIDPGIVFQSEIGVDGAHYTVESATQDYSYLSYYALFDGQMPFINQTDRGQHVIKPRLSYLIRSFEDNAEPTINIDAKYYESDYFNLFENDIQRGVDGAFSGSRVSLGLEYSYLDSSEWDITAGIGRSWVTPNEPQDDTTEAPYVTLNPNDLWLGFVDLKYQDEWVVSDNFALNEDYQLIRNEFALTNRHELGSYSFGWVWLDEEPDLNFEEPRSEFLLKGKYQYLPNWEVGYNVNYDLLNWEPLDAILGLTYGNECIEVKAYVNFDMPSASNDFKLEQSFDLSVDLFGLEKSRNPKWKKRECKY